MYGLKSTTRLKREKLARLRDSTAWLSIRRTRSTVTAMRQGVSKELKSTLVQLLGNLAHGMTLETMTLFNSLFPNGSNLVPITILTTPACGIRKKLLHHKPARFGGSVDHLTTTSNLNSEPLTKSELGTKSIQMMMKSQFLRPPEKQF